MKKIATILLICIYGLSSFGVAIKQFYCCGKLKSTSITFTLAKRDNCGVGDTKNGCCKDKIHFFKVKDNHIGADVINNPVKQFSELHLPIPIFEINPTIISQVTVANKSHAPPLRNCNALYILHCVYRI